MLLTILKKPELSLTDSKGAMEPVWSLCPQAEPSDQEYLGSNLGEGLSLAVSAHAFPHGEHHGFYLTPRTWLQVSFLTAVFRSSPRALVASMKGNLWSGSVASVPTSSLVQGRFLTTSCLFLPKRLLGTAVLLSSDEEEKKKKNNNKNEATSSIPSFKQKIPRNHHGNKSPVLSGFISLVILSFCPYP